MRILPIPFLLLCLSLALPAQVILNSDDSGSSGNTAQNVVRDAAGNLYALSISATPAGDRPLLLQISTDSGATWAALPITINDATSGLTAPNTVNNCSMAIDDRGVLHCLWSRNAYPSYYQQWYSQVDTATFVQSAIVNINTQMGASLGSRNAANDIAVDANNNIYIVAPGTSSWVERLAVSSTPYATALTFNSLGNISTSASAQNSRITVDANGLVHCIYYRNSGNGILEHRIYDPANGWQTPTLMGNTTPTRDLFGQLRADALGNVHALWVQDADNTTTWQYFYNIWEPVNGWGTPVSFMDITTAQYTNVCNYFITALGCDEDTGEAWVLYRDVPNGGQLELAYKGLTDPAFVNVSTVTAPTLAQHAYYLPTIRGNVWPAFDRMQGQVDMTWQYRAANPTPPFEFTYANFSVAPPTALTLTLPSPAFVGSASSAIVSGPTLAGQPYVCAFSEANGPGIPLSDGRVIPIDMSGFLFNFSLTPGNGIFFDTIGTLDGAGIATVTMLVPAVPALTGFSVNCAAVTIDPLDPTGVGEIANPLVITLQ